MQNVSTPLYQILSSFQRDLTPVDLFEFYAPDVTDLIPGNATKRFAGTSLVWYGWEYEQQAISRGDVSRYMTEKFNSVNITLSNVDRSVGNWLSTVSLEGWRVVIRMISRSLSNDSVVLFVGRLEKPGDVENARITLTAKQDLGTIENEIPFKKFDLKCPLKFKGEECLAGQAIGDKTQKYQEAGTCNKSWSQCFEYGNVKAFQGFRYKAVVGSFKVNSRSTGVSKAFGSRRATKQWTSTDNVPIGESVPVGMGRTQIDLTPVLYADTGQYLYGHFIAGEGEIADFADVRNTSAGWATSFQFKAEHKGQYGYEPDQATDSELLGAEHYSHRAYVEATIEGNNPDTGDPAPVLAALILWQKMASLGGGCFDNVEWSDNPVEHVRALLTDPRALGYPENWIDDEVAVDTATYCNEPMIDESGCEEFWYDQNNGTAGVDWKRYRSTGVLDWPYYKYLLGETTTRPQTLGPDYNAYDPENPPEDPPVTTFYRKRYTSNWHLKEPVKVADFLFKHLLPSFRGYLVTGADGKLQIKSERPAVSSFLRNAISPGDSSIAVEDVTAWQKLAVNQLFVLIGAGQDTSETRRVTGIEYSSAGNAITLSVTQGATAYAATFTGGSASTQAWNYFTVTSAATTAPAIVVIDGVTITGGGVDGQGNPSTIGSVAGELAARINANPTLNRYIEAVWTPENFAIVTLKAKLGVLQIDSGVTYSHGTDEKAVHVYGVFVDAAMGALDRSNIIRDSFKWPLGSRQSSYNQFSITYTDSVQDFQQTELRENDYDHQEKVNKINKLDISGACVDNYHQADRLVQAARYKYRDGDFFCSFQTSGVGLLLEEGDVICVHHGNMVGKRNQLFRIEELRITQDHRVNIVARLYSDEQFPESANVRTVGLNTGSVWIAKAPPAVTDATIVYTTIDSGRVEFDFGLFVGGQTARIEIKRPGDAAFLPYADVVPDGLGRGATEIPALEPNTEIRITPISSNGVAGSSTTLTATSPLYVWPAAYPPSSGYVLASDTDGNLSWVAQSGGGGTPGGSNTQVQYNDGGAFGGDSGLTYDETNKNLTVGNELRLSDDDASNYVALKAPSNVTSNVTLTLPSNDGDANQVLITDGSGGLSWGTPSAGVTDGDKGDITVSGTGATWTIDNDAVTYAKIQNVTDNRLLGRSAGTNGDVQEITVGTGLTLSSGQLRGGREVLTADRTYYVRTDGSDSNNGLTDSAGGAFLTIQKAVDVAGSIDPSIYDITIQVKPGTYAGFVRMVSMVMIKNLFIKGDTRVLAGMSYVENSGSRVPVWRGSTNLGGYAGVGAVTITRAASTQRLTITASTTNPNFSGDGWAAGDKILVYSGHSANTFTEYTLSAVGATTLDISSGSFPAIADGYMVTFVPNVKVAPTTVVPTGTIGTFSAVNTLQAYIVGFEILPTTNTTGTGTLTARDCVAPEANAEINVHNCLLNLNGGTENSGINGRNTKVGNYAPEAVPYPLTVVNGGYALLIQQNGLAIVRYIRAARLTSNCAAGYDRSYLDVLGSVGIKCGTTFLASRNAYLDARSTFSLGHVTDDYDPNPKTINSTEGSANLSYILT